MLPVLQAVNPLMGIKVTRDSDCMDKKKGHHAQRSHSWLAFAQVRLVDLTASKTCAVRQGTA